MGTRITVFNTDTTMYFRLIALGYFLVLVSASGEEKNQNPTAISALKTILEDYDVVAGDLQDECTSSNCKSRPGYGTCCEVRGLIEYCCPDKCKSKKGDSVDCRCFKQDGQWLCAGGVRFVINIWIIVALAVFNIKWFN